MAYGGRASVEELSAASYNSSGYPELHAGAVRHSSPARNQGGDDSEFVLKFRRTSVPSAPTEVAPVKSISAESFGLSDTESNMRQCTICFGDEDDAPGLVWSRPCRCRGTSQWVHRACIMRWIDEKQKKKGPDSVVRCEQCQYPYTIIMPPASIAERVLSASDNAVHLLSPFSVIVMGCTGLFHLSFRLGVIYSQVAAGPEVTEEWLNGVNASIPTLIMSLTPMALLGFNMIKWDEMAARFVTWSWQRACKLARRITAPKNSSLSPFTDPDEDTNRAEIAVDPPTPDSEYSFWLASSLSLPFASALCGYALFRNRPWMQISKTLAGGLAYLMLTGSFKVYCNLRTEQRRKKRTIEDCLL